MVSTDEKIIHWTLQSMDEFFSSMADFDKSYPWIRSLTIYGILFHHVVLLKFSASYFQKRVLIHLNEMDGKISSMDKIFILKVSMDE